MTEEFGAPPVRGKSAGTAELPTADDTKGLGA